MWHTIVMPSHLILDTHRWNPERDACPSCQMKPPDEVTSQWLEAPLDDGWLLALRVGVQEGWPVVAELRVFPDEGDDRDSRWPGCWSAERLGYLAPVPPGGLTARKLREVRLDTLLREQAKQILAQRDTILRRDHPTPELLGIGARSLECCRLRCGIARSVLLLRYACRRDVAIRQAIGGATVPRRSVSDTRESP